MTERERRIVLLGVLAAACGIALVLVPGLGDAVLPRVAAVLLTVAVGVGAVVVAVGELFSADDPETTLPTPETRPDYRRPGSELATILSAVGLVGRRRLTDDTVRGEEPTARERLHAALHELAVGVLSRVDGTPAGVAAERLQRGDWTDDAAAAAFFTGDLCPPLSRWAYLPGRQPDLPIVERAHHAVTALADLSGEPVPDPSARFEPPTAQRDDDWPPADPPETRATGRTRRVVVGTLLASGVGVVFGYPGTVLTATLGVALAGAARVWTPTVDLRVTRSLSTTTPAPGETVTVTVTIENTGPTTLPDIRVVDGVPTGLTVDDDSPRSTTALRPGRATTVSYSVTAVEGHHTFAPTAVVVGDVAGATETLVPVAATDGPTTLRCGFTEAGDETHTPRSQVTRDSGQRVADASGAGVEFDTLREYRPGDPPTRIDWHHRAKTGDLATVDFREPRRPRVVIVLDTRPEAYVAPTAGGIPGPRRGAVAAAEIGTGLLADGVPVGLTTTTGGCWISPQAGAKQRTTIRTELAGEDAVPWRPPSTADDVDEIARRVGARLDPDVQVVFVSPLCDDGGVTLARRLELDGHTVSVVSPDCTDPTTVEGAYGRLARRGRLSTLRSHGIPVTDRTPAAGSMEVGGRVTV
ncbi:DUF58 domain-containing protein [Halomicroarcula sp. GCM10025709]|uniref:DUF58 domain-containing protein n=1 Tax=Haloarcula TaxID=2237 RepID=UPI0024C287A2|nr:DUF58 domain-containing protein [Halomicroarcula sp. YJ-61-S]